MVVPSSGASGRDRQRVGRGTGRRDGLVRAARGAGAAGPPSARDPRALRCGAGQARSAGRGAPIADGPPVDPTGEVAPGDAAQALYSVRSQRQSMEAVDFDLLFPRFAGLGLGLRLDNAIRHPTTFPAIGCGRWRATWHVSSVPRSSRCRRRRRSCRPSTLPVDGTPIEAWPPMKRFRRKGRRHAASGRQRAQRRRGLARRDALRRDPCVRHRARRPAPPQGRRRQGRARLRGPCPHKEPARPLAAGAPAARTTGPEERRRRSRSSTAITISGAAPPSARTTRATWRRSSARLHESR